MLNANYEYFLAILEHGNISRAADKLYISQPSLTKYLQRLEQAVGAQLIDRTQNPVRLTLAGRYFRDYVIRIQEEEKNLRKKIYEIRNEGRDEITIGMALWRANVLLPAFLPVFTQKHPLIQVNLVEGAGAVLEKALLEEKIDFSIVNLPVQTQEVNVIELLKEHIFLVGSLQNETILRALSESPSQQGYPHIDLRAIADEPFILTQPNQHITNYINAFLSRIGIRLNAVFRTANVGTAVNLAAADMGFTFVPELGTKSPTFPSEKVALFTMDEPPLTCDFAAVYKKGRYLSQASKLFIRELAEFCTLYRWDASR